MVEYTFFGGLYINLVDIYYVKFICLVPVVIIFIVSINCGVRLPCLSYWFNQPQFICAYFRFVAMLFIFLCPVMCDCM